MKCKRWLALLLALGLLFSLCPVWAAEEPQETIIELGLCTAEPTSGDFNGYLVKLREDAIVPYSVSRSAQALGDGIYLVESEADAYALAGADAVEILEPNYRVELYSAVNDSYYSEQWYLNGTYGLSIETAWAAGLTGTGVKVAVLDTGLRPTHADIRYTSHVQPVYNATGDGYTGGYCPTAEGFHGTMVAGVISATANNGYGIAGAAYNATLYPVRVFDQNGYGYISYIVAGIDYAIEQEVDVINMSLGLTSYSPSLNAAVQRALAAGIIVVAAVGNDGNSVLSYPAACSGVVGVGATESDGTVATYSQKNESVWISAPGSNIFGLYTSSDYTFASSSGTSFASPCVAALAVLAKQYANQNGQDLTPARFANLLRLTAQDRGEEGYDTSYGWGAVDAAHMLAGMEARTIQFQLNGGTLPDGAVTTYIPYYSDPVSLPVPTREGWSFQGWFSDPSFSGESITSLSPAGQFTAPTYYALWQQEDSPSEDPCEHEYTKVITTQATCTDAGVLTYTCSKCGRTYTDKLSPIGHTPVNDSAVPATCTATGLTEGSHCSTCHAILTAQEIVPVLGHTWTEGEVTTPPTCTELGVLTRHCIRCGESKTEHIPANGHTSVSDPAIAATCTTGGLTEGFHCSVCNVILTEQESTNALGHSWGSGLITSPATCTTDGVKTYSCTRCNTSKTESIPATGHSWSEWSVLIAPTTDGEGTNQRVCSSCNEMETQTVPSLSAQCGENHTWNDEAITTSATCTEKGIKTYTCSRCGKTKVEDIPATGHNFKNYTFNNDATCTQDGTETANCENGCGTSHTRTKDNSATGHTWVNDEAISATCTTDGKTAGQHCSSCNTIIIAQEAIPATGHSFTSYVFDNNATCTEDGTETAYCDHGCGKTDTHTAPDSASGHVLLTIIEAATCMTDGYTAVTCTVCNETLSTQVIPAGGHIWDEGAVTTPATCEAEGIMTYTCTACSETRTEVIPAAGHSWDEGAVTTPATCEAGGVTTYTCTVCGGTRTEAIPATGHSWDGGTVTTPATCTTSGTLLLTCTRCGETRSQSISPLGHSYSGGSCTRCGASDPNDRSATQWPSSQPSEVKPLAKEPEPEPDPNTVTETNPDGSVTTTVTDPDTGTVTAVTQYTDGSSLEVETLSDGTVNTTQTRADQTVIQISQAPEQDPEVSVTLPQDVTDTVVTVALPDDSSRVAVDRETGDPIPLCTYLDGVLLVAVDDSVSFTLTALSSDYDDVSARSWYHDAVDFVSTRNLFQGYKDNTFQPKRNTSRAMVFTVLARLSNAELETGKRWYTGAMNWAMDQGISDGSRPGDDVTRQELITLLWRWAGTPEAPELEGYTDLGQVSSYARSAMAWAVDAGILTGRTDTTLAPVNTATRAETATIFQRLINYLVTQRADQL